MYFFSLFLFILGCQSNRAIAPNYQKMPFGFNTCEVSWGPMQKQVNEADMIALATAANSIGFTHNGVSESSGGSPAALGQLILGAYPSECRSPIAESWPLFLDVNRVDVSKKQVSGVSAPPVASEKKEATPEPLPINLKNVNLHVIQGRSIYLGFFGEAYHRQGEMDGLSPLSVTAEELAKHGISDQKWWLLPKVGPPVRAKIIGYSWRLVEVCGEAALGMYVELDTQSDSSFILAIDGTPPEFWFQDIPAPKITEQEARTKIQKQYPNLNPEDIQLYFVQDGWKGWLRSGLKSKETEDPCEASIIQYQTVQVSDAGTISIGSMESFTEDRQPVIHAYRDLDGDGNAEYVLTNCSFEWSFGISNGDTCCGGC